MVPGVPDVEFQKKLTALFVVGYFVLIFAFLGLGAALFLYPYDIPEGFMPIIAWMQGILGTLIGVLTGAVKDMCQFWVGSSKGSKDKSAVAVPGTS